RAWPRRGPAVLVSRTSCSSCGAWPTMLTPWRADDRMILAAIVCVATTGCAWRQLPPVFGASWPADCRRLHRRCERRADHFSSFAAIAAALIRHRRLTG
ncbi:transposase, partial [Streptosporangium sp. NPDC048865]|uniref:transposase n=1 Tax=Streptosporangium sp. NPDC048865 TaxID=3155766 RepID=UPI003412DF7B